MTPEERLENLNQLKNSTRDLLDIEMSLGSILEEQNRSISNFDRTQKQINRNKREQKALESTISKLQAEYREQLQNANDDQRKLIEGKIEELVVMQKGLNILKAQTDALEKNANLGEAIIRSTGDAVGQFMKMNFSIKSIWDYLQQVDDTIRTVQLNLGVSGEKAAMMREQFENSVNAAARFGASVKDIAELQEGITDITGRATAFREQDLLALVAIAKGTGLQNAEVSKLVGTMQNYGLSVMSSKDIIEESINSTAKLGLSSNVVLKKLGANIDKLNSYKFKDGVKGILEMAQASERFKFSMEGALSAADKFRTLEGLLETGANLRVLGGEFAKMDEFKLSFLARNDVKKFGDEMSKLTKGMATFNKETGEFDVTDINLDRLRSFAEQTNQPFNDLVQNAKKLSQFEFAKKQILVGTPAEREMIATLAKFKPGSTIGIIEVGGKEVELTKLTQQNIDLYKQEQKTLEQRSKDSQNFNKSFENTITQLKATMIPLLGVINSSLEFFNGILDKYFRDETGKLSALAAILPVGGILFGSVSLALVLGVLRGISSLVSTKIGGLFNLIGGGGGGGMNAAQLLANGKGLGYTLMGLGVAAAGIGTGFYLAAKGFSAFADSIKGMSGGELAVVAGGIAALTLGMYGIIAAAPAITGAAGALSEFGIAVGLIGAGIGLAGAGLAGIGYGIGRAAEGFNTKNLNFSGIESLGKVKLDNLKPIEVLQNFEQADIDRMNQMTEILNKISSVDLTKLNALEKVFTSGGIKFTLQGNPVIKNEIKVLIDGKEYLKKAEKMIPIVAKGETDVKAYPTEVKVG